MHFEVTINNQQQHPIITLKNKSTSAEIYAFGGLVNAFTVATRNGLHNIIDGFNSVEDAITNITNGFKSSFLSPFTCRMNNGAFKHANTGYKIEKFFLQPHAIHGVLFDAVYDIIDTNSHQNEASVTLEHTYWGTDKGYPFTFTVQHIWALKPNNELCVTTTVRHTNNTAIPYAQGWHPYFTLGGNVDNYTLQLDSHTMLEFDSSLLPTGKNIVNNDYAMDASLNGVILDNCFELDAHINPPKCVLSHNGLSVTIVPDSSYPYFQVYTPDHRQSIALENLSGAPDCFNNGIGLKLIEPNTSSIFTTSYFVSATNL
ncbi:aldose 1-epimerase [Parasediminibacterium paludis]|uniref:Aldose 1-epimerase n=1 Tax=Parasediminibacterium paludis TaxID=908966 RepID=A0ABV8PZ03_9BACT